MLKNVKKKNVFLPQEYHILSSKYLSWKMSDANNNDYSSKGYCVMYFFVFLILFILTIAMVVNRGAELKFN